MKEETPILSKDGISYVIPFILITLCFALWGFANDITNPMVKAFSKIFRMSVTDGALVQVAFYGGYFAMAIPAALFIRKFSYKSGVLVGLGLYALGAFLFLPAEKTGSYYPFLAAYFIMTCGLSFLETSCNPYILSMGPEPTATRRLNLAQSFNPCGSLLGMFVAMNFIQNSLDPMSCSDRALLSPEEFEIMKHSDLSILIAPYLSISLVIAVIFVIIFITRMPKNADNGANSSFIPTVKRLFSRKSYREGVLAQFFYVGAQIMCWTFIIQYGTSILAGTAPNGFERGILSLLGENSSGVLSEKSAEVLSQGYNIIAMIFFVLSRFVCTFLLKYFRPGRMLSIFALGGILLSAGVILLQERAGLYCLVSISICMSLMFPTIYGIALDGTGEDAKLGSAGLIMAILGGSVLPPLQASIIDTETVFSMPAVNVSFVLPLICFVVISVYGARVKDSNAKKSHQA
ncbi:MAG: L-fucose:H+ symporter permease [Bacteroidales bacterium]|nr:L-fucose:H+ symporter permease [Bacteroidales bacterium]